MDGKNKVKVLTVGLNDAYRAALSGRLGSHPQIETRHLDGWAFTITNHDVVILNVDSDAGQETLSMLRSFRGLHDPTVVTFSEGDDRINSWKNPEGKKASPVEIIPDFCRRLEAALKKTGCGDVHIDKFDERRSGAALSDSDRPGPDHRNMR